MKQLPETFCPFCGGKGSLHDPGCGLHPTLVFCGVWNGLDYLAQCHLPKGHEGQHEFLAIRPILDPIADVVLAHKPKPKSKPARKRARRAKKIAQAADV